MRHKDIDSIPRERGDHNGMSSWRGLHAGMVACYRDKKQHASWRWGKKKGLRRARRRLGKDLIRHSLAEV